LLLPLLFENQPRENTLGTSATRMVLYWQVSRCRQRLGRESSPGDTFPQLGQHSLAPCSSLTCTVTSPFAKARSTSATCQGLLMPII
jgi:hypothetical protein